MQHHSFFRGEKFVSVQEITGLATIISHDYNNSVKYTNANSLMTESESYILTVRENDRLWPLWNTKWL